MHTLHLTTSLSDTQCMQVLSEMKGERYKVTAHCWAAWSLVKLILPPSDLSFLLDAGLWLHEPKQRAFDVWLAV